MIDHGAFWNCNRLTSVTYLGTQSPCESRGIFDESNSINVCTSRDYDDNAFCGINVSFKSVQNISMVYAMNVFVLVMVSLVRIHQVQFFGNNKRMDALSTSVTNALVLCGEVYAETQKYVRMGCAKRLGHNGVWTSN